MLPPRLIQPEAAMLSRETLDEYRRMTVSERLALVVKMTNENTAALVHGRPEVVRRRFELLCGRTTRNVAWCWNICPV